MELTSASTRAPQTDLILHSLVLINVSDHITRELCRRGSGLPTATTLDSTMAIGALLGSLHGRHIIIRNSFELPLVEVVVSSSLSINTDWDFLRLRRGQYLEVFKDLDIVGWYVAGPQADPQALDSFFNDAETYCDSPVLLCVRGQNVMSPSTPLTTPSSPVPLHTETAQCCTQSVEVCAIRERLSQFMASTSKQSTVSIQLFIAHKENDHTWDLLPTPYHTESGEAEGIAVNHVISHALPPPDVASLLNRVSAEAPPAEPAGTPEESPNAIVSHLASWCQSAQQLKRRLDAAQIIVETAREQETLQPPLTSVLRNLMAICHAVERERDAITQDTHLTADIDSEALVTHLTSLTAASMAGLKGLADVNALLTERRTRLSSSLLDVESSDSDPSDQVWSTQQSLTRY